MKFLVFYLKWSPNLIKIIFLHENLSFLMKIYYFEKFLIGTLTGTGTPVHTYIRNRHTYK